MKKIIQTLFVFFFTIQLLYSQSANITEGCVPFEVDFAAPAGMSSYFWNFQNGTTSTLENPSGTFTSAGIFNVELYDQPGGNLVGTVQVSAFEQPELSIFASPSAEGCTPLNVTFSYSANLPQGVNIIEQQWVFGDGGNVSTTSPTANYTFQNGGNFLVSLEIITDASSCNVTQVFNDFIFAEEASDLEIISSPAVSQSCESPFDITFTPSVTDATSYTWDFGNGQTSNLQNPPMQTYTDGNFDVNLTIINSAGCPSSSTQLISVGSPLAIIDMPDTLCLNEPDTLDNGNPPLFYFWNFGPNANPQISGIASPIVMFENPGYQTVTLTVTSLDQSCATTVTKEIFVEQADATFTTDPSYNCANPLALTATATTTNAAEYIWYFPSVSNPELGFTPIVTVEVTDTSEFYDYSPVPYNLFETTLEITTSAGCRGFFTNEENPDTISLYKANFFENKIEGCSPLEVMFTDSSTHQEDYILWEWFVDDVLVQSDTELTVFDHTFINEGEHEVYLVVTTDNPNCPGDTSAIHTITVGHTYNLLNLEDQVICASENGTVVFDPPPGGFTTIDNEFIPYSEITITENAIYTENNGCITSLEFDLENLDGPGCGDLGSFVFCPQASINCSSNCEDPYTVLFNSAATNADDILWDLGDGTTSTAAMFEHTYTATGDYTVVLTATNSTAPQCPSIVTTYLLKIRDIEVGLATIGDICTPDSIEVMIDASMSVDVDPNCSTGYNWDYLYDDLPPFRTNTPILSEQFQGGTFDSLVLIVSDVNGCTDTTGIPIAVYGGDVEIDIDDDNVCEGQDISFVNLSQIDTTIASLEWDFGDGNTSNESDVIYSYETLPPNSSWYGVYLTITDVLGCSYQIKDTIWHYDITSSIIADSFVCLGQNTTISALDFTNKGSSLSYDWDFGNGETGTGQFNDVAYNEVGIHTITLNYEEIGSGCMRTTTREIEVLPFPEAAFISDNDNSGVLCYPANVFFTNTSISSEPLTYEWDFGNGQMSTLENPATVFEEGEYLVKLVVTNTSGCQDSIIRNYTVLNPQGSFVVDKNVICKGEEITFQLLDTSDVGSFVWDFGDGFTVADVSPITHAYDFHPPSGQTVASLILYGENGFCPFAVDTAIFIHEVIADFIRNDGVDTAICIAPYQFENVSEGADYFIWDFGDGTTSTETNPIHEYQEAGTYDVSLAIGNNDLGCVDTITYQVTLFPDANPNIDEGNICLEDELEIVNENYNPASNYIWSPQEEILTETDSSIIVSPTGSTTYYLSEITEHGCEAEDDALITVVLPNTYPDFDTTIVIGDSIALPVIYGDSYVFNWSPEEGLSCTDCSFPIIGPLTEEATYELNITDIYGCFDENIIFNISLHPETFINMPTTFTPNGDNINDELPVFGWGIKELKIYQIFNRWGEKVFETTDINIGWDGAHNGVPQNPDVYAFKIQATDWKDEIIVKEGYINLVR